MSILIANSLAQSYGAEDIFWDVTVSVARGDRIALVGRNGSGKTTLLRLLAGLDQPTSGSVHRARGLRIGFLPQEALPPEASPDDPTLWQEMMTAFGKLREMQARLRTLEEAMADPAQAEEALDAYARLHETFELAGGYTYEDHTRHVLMGLGFPRDEHDMPLAHLSGGQQTRALLARLLLESPDLLLLDEPTNYLDLQAIEWLEGYLRNWSGTVVMVAHDRYFMDRVANKVWELAFGGLEAYSGNYSHYVQQRTERYERLLKEYQAQQEFIARQEDFIQRHMAGQRTREAQGRLKRLDRFKRDEAVARPRQERTIRLRFTSPLRSGDLILSTHDVVVGYEPQAPLFACPDLDLRRTQRVALLGPNGSGKTTFLRTLLGELQPLAGRVRLGASLRVGYLAQVHADLNPNWSVLDTILEEQNLPLGEARSFLARFLFSGDDVFKRVRVLSGGERSRVALARLVLQRPNFLVLDEPTNHLDIASQEVLEEVLLDFEGTILLVTHDRYLVDRLATKLWILEPEETRLQVFKGTWAEYVRERDGERQPSALDGDAKAKWSEEQRELRRREQRARRRREEQAQRSAGLEAEIQHLEAQLKVLEGEIAAATTAQNSERLLALGKSYGELEAQLQERLDQWAELAR
jgi:ATP-binding cassette subfamily F protein 3